MNNTLHEHALKRKELPTSMPKLQNLKNESILFRNTLTSPLYQSHTLFPLLLLSRIFFTLSLVNDEKCQLIHMPSIQHFSVPNCGITRLRGQPLFDARDSAPYIILQVIMEHNFDTFMTCVFFSCNFANVYVFFL